MSRPAAITNTLPDRLRRLGTFRPETGEICHGLLPGQRLVRRAILAHTTESGGAIRRGGMEVGVLMTNTPGVNGVTGAMNVTIENGGKWHDVMAYHSGTITDGARSAVYRVLNGMIGVVCAATDSQSTTNDNRAVSGKGARRPCLCCPRGKNRQV